MKPKHTKKVREDMVEITEEYEGGVLISYKANGIEMPLPPFEFCKSVVIKRQMSHEDVKKFYGIHYSL